MGLASDWTTAENPRVILIMSVRRAEIAVVPRNYLSS
jgi:hypothetical protein